LRVLQLESLLLLQLHRQYCLHLLLLLLQGQQCRYLQM